MAVSVYGSAFSLSDDSFSLDDSPEKGSVRSYPQLHSLIFTEVSDSVTLLRWHEIRSRTSVGNSVHLSLSSYSSRACFTPQMHSSRTASSSWSELSESFMAIQNDMLRWLKANAGKPFFLFYTITLPHGRHEIDDFGIYKDMPWPDREKSLRRANPPASMPMWGN